MRKKSLLALLLVLLVLLAGCNMNFDDEAVRADTVAVLDALIDGNYMAVRAGISQQVTDDELTAFYQEISAGLAGIDAYELTAVGAQRKVENGVDYTAVAYQMTTADAVFDVEAVKVVGESGLAGFSIYAPEEEPQPREAPRSAVHWAFLAVAAVTVIFTIWMVVDCARRRMKRKWLWIPLIVLGTLILTFTMADGSVKFAFNVGLYYGFSNVKIYMDGSFLAQIYIPLGALVYRSQRRKLTLPEEAPPVPEMIG